MKKEDKIEKARRLFQELERKNKKDGAEIAKRAFYIHQKLAEIRD